MGRSLPEQAVNRLGVEFDRLRLRTGRIPEPLEVQRAFEALDDGGHVLMLCAGNICRSPLAHHYLERRLAERGIEDVTVDSAGIAGRGGRPSPTNAVTVATEHDIDLSEHRSKDITAELLAEADVAFLMDIRNYRYYVREFPEYAHKLFLLGAVSTRGPAYRDGDDEIIDPEGESEATFRLIYDEVTRAVDDLVDALAERR